MVALVMQNPGGGGGGGAFNEVLYGEAPPQGPTPHPYINYFSQKRHPFQFE